MRFSTSLHILSKKPEKKSCKIAYQKLQTEKNPDNKVGIIYRKKKTLFVYPLRINEVSCNKKMLTIIRRYTILFTTKRRREPLFEAAELHGIPYFLWANRGENQMRVWLPYIQGR